MLRTWFTKGRMFDADKDTGSSGASDNEGESQDDNLPGGGESGSQEDNGKSAQGGGADSADKKLRQENQSLRKRLRELEEKEKQREDSEKSELERAKGSADAASQQVAKLRMDLRKSNARLEVSAVASELGLEPGLCAELVKFDELEFDDDSNALTTDVKALLTKLAEKWPNIKVGTAKPASGNTSPANPPRDKKTVLTKATVAAMTPEQVNANWDEISKLMAAGQLK